MPIKDMTLAERENVCRETGLTWRQIYKWQFDQKGKKAKLRKERELKDQELTNRMLESKEEIIFSINKINK